MKGPKAIYVPWLHMHQPLISWKINEEEKLISNLQKMLFSSDPREAWDAKLIARAYKNPAKYVKKLREEGYQAKIMLDYSGILLESLENLVKQKIFDKVEIDGEKIGDIIGLFKEVLRKFPDSIEFAGTAYSHCYFPATPEEDWVLQIEEWRNVFKKIFGRKNLERVKGFWLPEMGIPAFEDKQAKLIKAISEYYEWLILPLQALEGYEKLSYEERIKIFCTPHLLKVKGQSIPIIFRVPTYFIDQQAGCEAKEVYKKALEARKISNKKPSLLVPACDGENGNVMMNEFFPKTFVPFFKELIDERVSSLTVSEFLYNYYSKNGEIKPESEIKIKSVGASWVDTHRFWLEGTRKLEIVKKVEILSKDFHKILEKVKSKEGEIIKAKKSLLIAESSCYIYWGSEFWFSQGEKAIQLTKKKIDKLVKFLNLSR